MGVDLADIATGRTLRIDELAGRKLAVDAHNILYQFLAIIRQPDGTPLKDGKGRVTSHLSGLLYRTGNLVAEGLKPVFVFDGVPPEVKRAEIEARRERKARAREEYEAALEAGDLERARSKAAQTSKLTDEMLDTATALLDALGIPHLTAPGEGEAQAAHMARRGDVWGCVSQDHDTLLCGAPRLVKNLTVTGRRKLPGRNRYVDVEPELVVLEEVLDGVGLTREQLVDVALLCGTDFNDGVKGIGPKRGLKKIGEHGSIEAAVEAGALDEDLGFDPDLLRPLFLEPDVTDDADLVWREVDEEAVVALLCGEHDFSKERVGSALQKYRAFEERKKQRSLEDWS